MPDPRDRPRKIRSPAREGLLPLGGVMSLRPGGGVVVAVAIVILRSAEPLRLLAAVHRMPGPAGLTGPGRGRYDRVGTISRTFAAISAGSGA
ncbi:hypothetical protein GCM10023237_35870 [Streptomyces coeruleoprunus]